MSDHYYNDRLHEGKKPQNRHPKKPNPHALTSFTHKKPVKIKQFSIHTKCH